jgi:hypothetical protein
MRHVYFSEEMGYTPFQIGQARNRLEIPEVSIVSTADEADVVCARTLTSLVPYLQMNKAFLIWTPEPSWCVTGGDSFHDSSSGQTIHVSTAFNGDAYPTPLHYFPFAEINYEEVVASLAARERFCLILASYRHKFDRIVNDTNVDLVGFRQRLALHLQKKHDSCDIFGIGWPSDVPVVEQSRGPGWQARKRELLAGYQFNVGCENTATQNYISEKIWDSILAGTVTVYFGKGSGIENLLRPSSYVDPGNFADFDELYRFMRGLTLADRTAIVESALEDYERIKTTNRPQDIRKLRLDRFAKKLHDIC